MVLDLMGAFSEHDMSLAISVINQNENGGRGRVAALQVTWYTVRQRLPGAFEPFICRHSWN